MALLQNAQLKVLKLGYNSLENEGAMILATGIAQHMALESLDLGFNNVGDEGCCAIAKAVRSPPLHTLYLAGNLFTQDGAMAIADLVRRGEQCSLRKLYLTGNRLGPDGVKYITDAIVEQESIMQSEQLLLRQQNGQGDPLDSDPASAHAMTDTETTISSSNINNHSTTRGLQELFLGGTALGSSGCRAVARVLATTRHLRVLSMPNCDLGDDDLAGLAASLKSNRDHLRIESLQLSFNQFTGKGIEPLVNALWGLKGLKELLLDNNTIGDVGAQLLAAIFPQLTDLETLDVGFNDIKSPGIKVLMSAIANSQNIETLSLSGNTIDATGAKAVAYALALNCSLVSISLLHCSVQPEIHRQIVAGIVSNSKLALRDLSGFSAGPAAVSLGFPAPIAHWTNDQVLNFVHSMWDQYGEESLNSVEDNVLDPLHFLPSQNGSNSPTRRGPVDPTTVVEVAKKAFDSLVENGVDIFTRRPGHPNQGANASPISYGIILTEDTNGTLMQHPLLTGERVESFVAPPEPTVAQSSHPDPARKKRIVEWLCQNIHNLKKIAQLPFSSAELWRLHQHYFTPVVNESGGSVAPSPNPSAEPLGFGISSVPDVSRGVASDSIPEGIVNESGAALLVPVSDPSLKKSPDPMSSLPMLKRKVSYRFLGDAALAAPSSRVLPNHPPPFSTSSSISRGQTNTLPRKSKRARRNRNRISFLPRVKDKLDSYLDVCHEKALVVMRQLYFVEQAILRGDVNPIDPSTNMRTHLAGDFAADAEIIVVDMI
jgi:Ran GTPase-activating protein (RanGAP) involved in mRNA processing and transport